MYYGLNSPLKAIEGAAIKDLTDGRFHPRKIGRSRSPRRRPTILSSSSASSLEPQGLRLSCVSIPTKPKHIPNQRSPPKVHSSLPDGSTEQNERSRKVIVSRFLLVDGNISFAIGTQVDGIITPDAQEVPLAKILDYVSPAELERYENQDFFDEDERERLLPPKKHRGRPRKGDTIVPSFNIAPIGEETSREQSLLPGESISIKKKIGRPRGSYGKKGGKLTSAEPSIQSKIQIGRGRPIAPHKRGPYKKKANTFTSMKPSALSGPSTAIKKPRGRPPRQKNLAVVIPSFNGPQPQELGSTPGAESESDEMLNHPKPQYSMVAASGLGQSDTEDMTSRDQSVELVPSSKRRRLNTSNAVINLDSDDNDDERSPHPTKRAKTLPETSPDPIADDSTALLRQFQARVYGPDHSAKTSTIPHRQSKASPTLDDSAALLRQFQDHTRPSSLDSSSSNSLMGPTPRPPKPLPAQYVSNQLLPGEPSVPQCPPPGDNKAKMPGSCLNNSITVSRSPRPQPAKATPSKATSPSKPIQRKVSFTPHFPPSTSFSHKSLDGSAQSRPQSSISSTSRPGPTQPTNTTFSQSSRIMPSPPKKRKPSPVPRSAPPQSSQASSTSKIGFAGLPRAKDITDYFAPKATIAKTAPIKTRHSPGMQLLDPEDSESEDRLAREPSTDSNSSEIIVIRQNRVTPTNQAATAEASPHEPSNGHDRTDEDETEDNSSEDESEDSSSKDDNSEAETEDETKDETEPNNEQNKPLSTTTAPAYSPASPKKIQSSAEALSKAFEIGDDEDSGSDSDSNSDSLSSEVMIVRPS